MKKILYLLLVSVFMAAPAAADVLISDTDPPDTNPSYWTGSDTNPSSFSQLNNSNPDTEEAFLEALLGKYYNDPSVNFAAKIDNPLGGPNQLINYNPGIGGGWDYAVVKYGDYWAAYADNPNDNLLTTGSFDNGVSHVTFFADSSNGNGNGTKVPEPTTMLLLGLGLVGLAGVRRKFRS